MISHTLDLVNENNTTINYKINKFPDGQQNIAITQTIVNKCTVLVKSRFRNFMDLELIICAIKCLKRISNIEKIELYIPYLLGARSDRLFQDGGNSYLVDVVAPILNSLKLDKIFCLDIHNEDVAAACINNLYNISSSEFVSNSIKEILIKDKNLHIVDTKIVVPDGGALKRIYNIVKEANYEEELLICHKHRDVKTGKLLSFNVPIGEKDKNKTLIWIDDLVDGGGSFIGEAQEANKNGHVGKKFLLCTHGIFSNGLKELSTYFDGIYCTNSYNDIGSKNYNLTQFSVF